MSDVEKMYQAPEKLGEIQTPTDGATGVTPQTRQFIGQAAAWLKFIGVMGFIGCGFIALFGVIAIVMPGVLKNVASMKVLMTSGMSGFGGIIYLGIAVAMFFPARFMYQMGIAANGYHLQGQPNSLQELVLNLKKWAKFNGVFILIWIGILILFFIGAIVYGIVVASKNL